MSAFCGGRLPCGMMMVVMVSGLSRGSVPWWFFVMSEFRGKQGRERGEWGESLVCCYGWFRVYGGCSRTVPGVRVRAWEFPAVGGVVTGVKRDWDVIEGRVDEIPAA